MEWANFPARAGGRFGAGGCCGGCVACVLARACRRWGREGIRRAGAAARGGRRLDEFGKWVRGMAKGVRERTRQGWAHAAVSAWRACLHALAVGGAVRESGGRERRPVAEGGSMNSGNGCGEWRRAFASEHARGGGRRVVGCVGCVLARACRRWGREGIRRAGAAARGGGRLDEFGKWVRGMAKGVRKRTRHGWGAAIPRRLRHGGGCRGLRR